MSRMTVDKSIGSSGPIPRGNLLGFPLAWSVNRLVVLALLGGFLGILLDVRLEHVSVVRQHWIGWTPMIYSGLMIIVSCAAMIRWSRGWRRRLFWCYAAAFAVGAAGFWLHSNGHPDQALMHVLAAWYSNSPHRGPPALAPLSFGGLGLMGMLASAERLQGERDRE
jgi:hypothetical protein